MFVHKEQRLFLTAILSLSLVAVFSGCGGDHKSSLAGKWETEEPIGDLPKNIELFEGGNGIFDGAHGVTWEAEKGRMIFTVLWMSRSFDYKISGSMLTFTDDTGNSATYKKQK